MKILTYILSMSHIFELIANVLRKLAILGRTLISNRNTTSTFDCEGKTVRTMEIETNYTIAFFDSECYLTYGIEYKKEDVLMQRR